MEYKIKILNCFKNYYLGNLTEKYVKRILFDGKKAIGVEILSKNKKVEKIYSNKEIILP